MITFTSFIHEARKFPHLNPKIPVNDEIINHFKSAKGIPRIQAVNSFTSFTTVDKLGINPKSRYNTPLGIYAYPNSYIYKEIGKEGLMANLPFAGDSPFANIFSVKGNIIRLNHMQPQEANDYYKKIIDFYVDLIKVKRGSQEWKTEVDLIDDIINESSQKARHSRSVGGRFWYVTMKVSNLISSKTGKKPHIAWNMLFRGIGIDGFIDIGEGIIHPAEETQAVFFSIDTIVKNKRVDNKYSPDAIKPRVDYGLTMRNHAKTLQALSSDDERKDYVMRNPEAYNRLKNPGADFERAFYDEHGIKYIENPSIDIQLIFIDKSPYLIYLIKNPPEKVQLAAVNNEPHAIKNIENPSEKIQLAAVNNNGRAINHIKNPSEKIQLAAVNNKPRVIEEIKNPTEKVQLAAIDKDPSLIYFIKNPSEKVQLAAVNNDPNAIQRIKNPTPKVTALAKSLGVSV